MGGFYKRGCQEKNTSPWPGARTSFGIQPCVVETGFRPAQSRRRWRVTAQWEAVARQVARPSAGCVFLPVPDRPWLWVPHV